MTTLINNTPPSLSWTNKDLCEYYENVPINELKQFTVIGGLDNCCEIELIRSYINQASSILEIGAGYGRVVEDILKHGYKNKLTAIERCKKFCNYMREKFVDSLNQLNIIEDDFMTHNFDEKYDLILSMWSNISEYSIDEQLPMLHRLKNLLTTNGVLVVETIDHNIKPKNSTIFNKQAYVVNSKYGTSYGYTPSDEQLREYALALEVKNIKQIAYRTDTDRKRLLTIIFS